MEKVSLWEIFAVFAKIGAFTIGGGYVMVPAIQSEIERRGWLDKDELPDIVALAQSAPGVIAVNMSIFTGYRLRGVKGSIAATLGSILPSFVLLLLIAMVFTSFQENRWVIAFFTGARPVTVALIFTATIKMARKKDSGWWYWPLALLVLAAVVLLKFSPIYVLLTLIVFSCSLSILKENKK